MNSTDTVMPAELIEATAKAMLMITQSGVAPEFAWSAQFPEVQDELRAQARAALTVLTQHYTPSAAAIDAAARTLFEPPSTTPPNPEYTWAEMTHEDPARADLWRADALEILHAALAAERQQYTNHEIRRQSND